MGEVLRGVWVGGRTMTPSVAARISSNLSRPSWFSILAMILMSLPSGPRTWLELGLGSGLGVKVGVGVRTCADEAGWAVRVFYGAGG